MKDIDSTINLLGENLSYSNKLTIALIILLILNVALVIVKYFLDRALKNKEKEVYRKNLIADQSIKVQDLLFGKLSDLTLFSNQEQNQMLTLISEIESVKRHRGLYLSATMSKLIDKMLDYFKSVVFNFNKNKNYLIEENLFEEFTKQFNKK